MPITGKLVLGASVSEGEREGFMTRKKSKLTKYRYRSNNSGGDWWLSDNDWKALEKAGWKVEWVKDKPRHRGQEEDRWLGALATTSTKSFKSEEDAVSDFEKVTGANYYEEGCSCCGCPHYISEAYE